MNGNYPSDQKAAAASLMAAASSLAASSSSAASSSTSTSSSSTSPAPSALSMKCLCFNLAVLPSNIRFLFLTVCLLFFFMFNSYVEEYLFKSLPSFKFGWYLTFFELFCFSMFAIIERTLLGDEHTNQTPAAPSSVGMIPMPVATSKESAATANVNVLAYQQSFLWRVFHHRAALSNHLIVAIAMTFSRGLTNVSLQYLSYPTQVIFKSMKLLTVMLGSILCLGRKFSGLEYLSAMLLVVSAILFSMGDSKSGGTDDQLWGYVIVCISLFCDSMHSNTQEALVREHRATTLEAMLFTNLFASAMAFVYIVYTGELQLATAYCKENPQAYYLFVVRAVVIYGGVVCYMLLVKAYGAVVATGLTTVRKILTIIASFLFFSHPLSLYYFVGFLAFCAAVAISVQIARHQQLQRRRGDDDETQRATVELTRRRNSDTQTETDGGGNSSSRPRSSSALEGMVNNLALAVSLDSPEAPLELLPSTALRGDQEEKEAEDEEDEQGINAAPKKTNGTHYN